MNITELCSILRLPYIRENWRQLLDEAKHTGQDYEAFLGNLLDSELRLRLENGQARRIKDAKFPLKKYLVDFKRDKYDTVFVPKFEELETLGFIPNRENIILPSPQRILWIRRGPREPPAPARRIMLSLSASPPV